MKEDEDATGSARTTMAEWRAKVRSRGLVHDSVCEHFVDDAAGCLHDPVVKKYEHLSEWDDFSPRGAPT